MESEVRIKATINDIYHEFKTNKLFSIKRYSPLEKIPDNVDENNDIFVFDVLIRHEELPKNLTKTTYTLKGLEKAILRLRNTSYDVPKVRILGVVDYTIPMCGNKRCLPYGKLKVTDGITTKIVPIKDGDSIVDYKQYITFNRKRYYIRNIGGLHTPKYEVIDS